MEPVSGADRVAALLKQRLLARARKLETGRPDNGPPSVRIDLVSAPGPVQGDDERQRRRTLIQNILAEEFGDRLVNDAEFQQVVDRVLSAIESDATGSALLMRVLQSVGPL
jgi:hypothetical protein